MTDPDSKVLYKWNNQANIRAAKLTLTWTLVFKDRDTDNLYEIPLNPYSLDGYEKQIEDLHLHTDYWTLYQINPSFVIKPVASSKFGKITEYIKQKPREKVLITYNNGDSEVKGFHDTCRMFMNHQIYLNWPNERGNCGSLSFVAEALCIKSVEKLVP